MEAKQLYSEIYGCDPAYKCSKHRFEKTVRFLKTCGVKELKKEYWRSMKSMDVCCGRGEIVDLLEFYGYLAMGTEIVPDLIDGERVFKMSPFPQPHDFTIQYGKIQLLTCFDALEHFTKDGIDVALECFAKSSAREIILSISTREAKANKKHGVACGHKLHLTVEPPSWWIFKLKQFWPDCLSVLADATMGMVWVHIRNR